MNGYQFNAASNILVLKWQDNKIFSAESNHFILDPLRAVKREVKWQIGKTMVLQICPLREYNWYIGGVDLHDWLVSKYAVSIRGNKRWNLFVRLLGMAVINACTLFNTFVDKEKEMTYRFWTGGHRISLENNYGREEPRPSVLER